MSGFSHPIVRPSDRNPRAEAVGDNGPSNGQNSLPKSEMETTIPSSATATESSDSADEQLEQVTASPSLVSRSPGVGLGLDAIAAPFPPAVASEVKPEDAEVNTGRPSSCDYDLSPANALVALSRSAPGKNLSNEQFPLGSPSDENEAVYSDMSVSALSVPISHDVTMPVLVHAYASSPGRLPGLDQPRPTPSSSDFQSLFDLLNTVVTDVKAVRSDAGQRSAEMYDMLMDVEHIMLERESHFMSEIEA